MTKDISKVLLNTKKITVEGTEYTLQKMKPRQALEVRNQWQEGGVPNEIKMFDLVLEHIVISPQVTLDDFEELTEVEEVVRLAMEYQYVSKGK